MVICEFVNGPMEFYALHNPRLEGIQRLPPFNEVSNKVSHEYLFVFSRKVCMGKKVHSPKVSDISQVVVARRKNTAILCVTLYRLFWRN